MKTLYLWVEEKGWTPFQYNDLSELTKEFVSRNIKLGYGCELGNWCEVGYKEQVRKTVFITASRHSVSYWGAEVIQIGCKRFSISEWQQHFQKIGQAENYTSDQIEEYKGYIDLIAAMHKTWSIDKQKASKE